ncbi:MAG: DUF1549 domain-containing protein, partial [Pirellula sp.]
SPVAFARNVREHLLQLTLKRLQPEFKGNVSILGYELPKGWTLTTTVDKDAYNLKLVRAADATAEMEKITLGAVADFKGRSRLETIHVPIQWIDRIDVYPQEVSLEGNRSRQQILVTAYDSDNSPRDWTRGAKMSVADPTVAEVRNGVVYPKSNGTTALTIEAGQVKSTVPITVANMEQLRSVAFENEVLVALSKQGCNSGACHGSPSGKGGFRLSLRAFDAKLDELTLMREEFGRRVNTIDADLSLLLTKPLMKVAHGGGKQLRTGDAAYGILRDWIAGGAKADPDGTPRCVRVEVAPEKKRVLRRDLGGQQLAVTAYLSDGTKRDVTQLAAYESSNTSVATIDRAGFVTPHQRGEAAILVRFLEHIESLPLMFVEDVPNFEWRSPPPFNYIDGLVNAKLQQLQITPSETCDDSEFVRRVYLDLIGILPAVEETKEFLSDSAQDKRARLVDRLLERDEFAKFWALKWGDLLKLTSKAVGDEGVFKYHRWIEDSIRNNMPYDEFARQLLLSNGSTLANPTANFYRTASDVNECVESISQVFMGARLQCAKCHNHPFERWTQDNYYGLAAFFNRIERRKTQRPGEMFVWSASSGDVVQPRTGKTMNPWLPLIGTIDAPTESDRRGEFVRWLTGPSNRYFARIEANRIWSQFFARGIVDPIDDFRESNPPANEPLLDALAKEFIDHGFDRKQLIRTILNSRTYQADYQTNEFNKHDTTYFSHQEPRMLTAEQLLDAINRTMGLSQQLGNLPEQTLATQLPAPDLVKVDFLKAFGQPDRNTVCACERVEDSNLGMAIELFNGKLIHEKLRDPQNRFRKALASKRTVEEIIRELYLASVCREPNAIELQAALSHCNARDDIASGIEDFCWAILNTDEFLFQH